MEVVQDIKTIAKHRKEQVTRERAIASKECYCCKQVVALIKLCKGCKKTVYCSKTCQKKHRLDHRISCLLISAMVGTPGYNDRLEISNFSTVQFRKMGRTYLSSSLKGVVAFTEFPMSKKEFVETELAAATNTACFHVDLVRNVVVHYFIVPVASLEDYCGEGGFSKEFVEFVNNDAIYGRFIPICQLRMQNKEVVGLKFAAIGFQEE